MNIKNMVEAALFSSDEPLKISEISEKLNISKNDVRKAINQLKEEYRSDERSIEIFRIGQKYVMQLKEEYTEIGYKFSKPEIDREMLKTLALIAYLQPVKISDLRKYVGEKLNDHIKMLKEKRLVYSRKYGKSTVLGITKYFGTYFGIDISDPKNVREYLIKKLNVDLGDDSK